MSILDLCILYNRCRRVFDPVLVYGLSKKPSIDACVNPNELLYRALFAAGLRPIPQYDVEKYVHDFALLDGHRRLNVEVDGERYHRNWDGELLRRDQIRNERLMELGWDIMRFWVYQVRDGLAGCVSRVQGWYDTDG